MNKKKKLSILISIVLVTITILLTFTFCSDSYKLDYGNGTTRLGDTQHIGTVVCAVKSKNDEFKVDEVEFDVYFGSIEELKLYDNDDYELVSYAIYFVNVNYIFDMGSRFYPQNIYSDYKNIEGYHFIKELSFEEFSKDDYKAKIRTFSNPKINHHEKIKVPAEVFEGDSGQFAFVIVPICAMKKEDGYFIGPYQNGYGKLHINYEYTNESTVKLFSIFGYNK